MKKLTALFCLLMALTTILTVAVFAAEYVTMYAPDGRTRQTLKSEVELYKSVGWYANKSDVYVTMYALDGRTRDTLKKEVEAYKKVGWFTDPVTLMYAADGRTRVTLKSEVEAYKRVGWFANKSDVYVTMYAADGRTRDTLKKEVEAYKKVGWYANKSDVYVTMYAPDGRTRDTLKKEVEAYKKVGWYISPVTLMYAADGRTRVTLKSEVEAYKRVGWYVNKSDVYVTMYALDGRTRDTLKKEVEAYKKVGWYTAPVVLMYAPDGRTRVTYKSEVEAYKKVGWYTMPVTILYDYDGRTKVVATADASAYLSAGWFKEPIAAHVHRYDYWRITAEATCTAEGVKIFTCAICGKTCTESIPMSQHVYVITAIVPSTCVEKGYTQYTCTVCGDTYKDMDSGVDVHVWGTWEVTKIPTYTEAGEHMSICTSCGAEERISLGCLVETPEEIRQEVLRLVNIEREKVGAEPLRYYKKAQIAVDARAQDLQLLFSHTRPDGTNCFGALNDYNVSSSFTLGENLAMGYVSPEDVVDGWMNSPGHRANMLSTKYTHIAIGMYDYGWVQMFFG